MRKLPGVPPEVDEQSRWFETAFQGWVRRRSELRETLIQSLHSDDFEEAFEGWLSAEIDDDRFSCDLRQAREQFQQALSEVGGVEIGPSRLYDIVHDVAVFSLAPVRVRPPGVLGQTKAEAEAVHSALQHLIGALRGMNLPASAIQSDVPFDLLERVAMQYRIEEVIQESALGRALEGVPSSSTTEQLPSHERLAHALGDLAERLGRLLLKWEKRGGRLGRPPNMAVSFLLHRLAWLYEDMGGELTAAGFTTNDYPESPFAKFLTLIYVAMPETTRLDASETKRRKGAPRRPSPAGFIAHARRVLLDRAQGIELSGQLLRPDGTTRPF